MQAFNYGGNIHESIFTHTHAYYDLETMHLVFSVTLKSNFGYAEGSDGAVANASTMLALVCLAVVCADQMFTPPDHVVKVLSAITVFSKESKNSMVRVVD